MNDKEIFEWVDGFPEIDSRGLDCNRAFVKIAIASWFKKDSFLFIYNLRLSVLTAAQIVHFAMRENILEKSSEDVEADFWRDLKRYFEGVGNFSFYK